MSNEPASGTESLRFLELTEVTLREDAIGHLRLAANRLHRLAAAYRATTTGMDQAHVETADYLEQLSKLALETAREMAE